MANTRARSYNTLTYNGGKHMLNSKIAMKKRLLHKYRIEPPTSSANRFFAEDKSMREKLESHAGLELCAPSKADVENSSVTVQPVQNPVFPSEDVRDEPIDVETITESADDSDPTPTEDDDIVDSSNKADDSPKGTPKESSSVKPSLEEVIKRCRLKSNEAAFEASVKKDTSKTALESLKDVVNSVTPIESDQDTTPVSEGKAFNFDTESDHSSSGSKRYLSSHAKTVLSEWFRKHLYRPYPTYEEKKELAALCGISSAKVDTWFANKRNRTQNTKKLPPKYSHLFSFSGVNSE